MSLPHFIILLTILSFDQIQQQYFAVYNLHLVQLGQMLTYSRLNNILNIMYCKHARMIQHVEYDLHYHHLFYTMENK